VYGKWIAGRTVREKESDMTADARTDPLTGTQPESASMRALVQEGHGSADVLHIRSVPRPVLLDDRVLVRVRAASVNALDWHSVHGGTLMRMASKVMRQKEQPIRGADFAGVIEAVGSAVTRFRIGDEVFGSSAATFAEYARARADKICAKPPIMTFEEAAPIGVAGGTAYQGLVEIAGLKAGDRVLVYGAGGGVGTFAVQIAKALGAHVTAVTGPRNVDLVRGLGPDELREDGRDDVVSQSDRYDIVLDISATRSLSDLRRVVAPGGILVLVGADKRGGVSVFTRIISALIRARVFKQRIKFFVARNDPDVLLKLTELFEQGKLRPAIDRTFPLDQAAEAVRYVGTGRARAKVVITV
jgi:NADPH:quinone reductase-like Zn-dependent oxidoreductase